MIEKLNFEKLRKNYLKEIEPFIKLLQEFVIIMFDLKFKKIKSHTHFPKKFKEKLT